MSVDLSLDQSIDVYGLNFQQEKENLEEQVKE